MSSIVAAAIQVTSTSDKKENYKKVAHFVGDAAARKATLIVLPEHWEWLGNPKEKRELAETKDGPSIQFLQTLAKQHSCTIIGGSIIEKNGESPPFNTTVVVHSDGTLGKIYRKIHLFDTDLHGYNKESDYTSAGNEVVVESFDWGTVGFSICYDVRFPELYRQLARKGANIIVVPSNFTAVTGPPHWEVLLRARAIENQCFVIAADQTGMTGAGWEAHGHSMIIDPWGDVLAMAGREEGIVVAELKLDRLNEVRGKMPVHRHRKLG